MDEAVKKAISRGCALLGTVVGLAFFAAGDVLAETLSDPTRPAIGNEQLPVAEGVTAPQVGVGMVVTAREGVMALMDGRILRVGSRTDSGVVVSIAPDAVFVRSSDGKTTRLPLYPGVSVQAVSHVPEATGRAVATEGKRQKQKPGKTLQRTQVSPQNRSTAK